MKFRFMEFVEENFVVDTVGTKFPAQKQGVKS